MGSGFLLGFIVSLWGGVQRGGGLRGMETVGCGGTSIRLVMFQVVSLWVGVQKGLNGPSS